MSVLVKICGIKNKETIQACGVCGVKFLGFNFCRPSPRYITPTEAGALAKHCGDMQKVALTVDADDDTFATILKDFPANLLQLHGNESPARVAAIKSKFNLPIIKALAINDEYDLEETLVYESMVDYFLFDAKPPPNSELTGGNAIRFDWNIMQKAHVQKPWFLAGGLTPENIKEAITQSSAQMLDVASGVESARGEKSIEKIEAFMQAAKFA